MAFGQLVNDIEIPKKPEKYKAIAELSRFASENGNPIVIKDFGMGEELELLKNNKIKSGVLEGLNEEKIEKVKYSLKIFKSFLKAIVFTDIFDLDHPSRTSWEESYVENGKLSPEAKRWYKSNRLNTNEGWNAVLSEITELEETIFNQDIKKELENLKNKIPRDFFDKYEV